MQATYRKLCPSSICHIEIGQLRVYVGDNITEPEPYKFVTTAVIEGEIATLHGVNTSLSIKDVKAIDKALAAIGVTSVRWIHKTKLHSHKIK